MNMELAGLIFYTNRKYYHVKTQKMSDIFKDNNVIVV